MSVFATLASACVPTGPALRPLDGCRATPATAIRAQNETGAPLYALDGALDGGVLRDTSACGAKLFAFDGTFLRHRNLTGAALYHFDGKLLRAATASGARLLYRDGQTWRAFGPSGAALFHFDGTRLRHRNASGAVIAYFDRPSPSWAAIAVLEAEGLVPS
ncbi:MAG: hypothetical protein AAGG09_09175 [Pseudomonadota bacterium]